MPEWVNPVIVTLDHSWVFILSPAIFVFYLRKDWQAFRFTLITAIFFLYGALIYSSLREFDEPYIYRYVVWAANDLIWMALIAYWAIKDKVYVWQSVLGQLVVISAPILQLFRVLDRHLWDLSYSTYLYKTLLPLINTGTVVVCYLPLIYFFMQRDKKSTQVKN